MSRSLCLVLKYYVMRLHVLQSVFRASDLCQAEGHDHEPFDCRRGF